MKCELSDIEKLPVPIIQEFRRTGVSLGIPTELQQYILQLDRAVEIFNVEKEHNISRAARKLMESFPEMAFSTAKTRIYDAINYFHLNNTVKAEAWNNYYADRFEDLGKLALKKFDFTESRRCFERAAEYRKEASQVALNPDAIKPHTFLISPEVTPELLGMTDKSLKKMWIETEQFIDGLPINQKEKNAIKREAALNLNKTEDAEFEDLE